ncbi:MAG TPA: hypothetical protein VF648_18910 [Pyrinomonadaceae bacterium]|jgi:hypothetical protein
MENITDKTKKALQILADHPEITARRFGELMWSDSEARTRSYNTGNGATRGKGLWFCAGGYLAKLQKRGLVYRWCNRYQTPLFSLTSKGVDALKEIR